MIVLIPIFSDGFLHPSHKDNDLSLLKCIYAFSFVSFSISFKYSETTSSDEKSFI